MLVVVAAVERLLELVVQVAVAMVETTAMALQEPQTQVVVVAVAYDQSSSGRAGGAGGSGIVILKYLVPVGTTVTHIYKGSGSWVAPEGVTAIDWL
jgi:hypothetical protein